MMTTKTDKAREESRILVQRIDVAMKLVLHFHEQPHSALGWQTAQPP
jgi:hypothetical protein